MTSPSTNAIKAAWFDVCKAAYELVLTILGAAMLIAGAIDGATSHDYAHGCYDLLVAALCLGWLSKGKSK